MPRFMSGKPQIVTTSDAYIAVKKLCLAMGGDWSEPNNNWHGGCPLGDCEFNVSTERQVYELRLTVNKKPVVLVDPMEGFPSQKLLNQINLLRD